MTENNNSNIVNKDDNLIEKEDTQENFEEIRSESKENPLNSRNIVIGVVAVISAFICYKLFFGSKGNKKDVVDTESIVMTDKNVKTNTKNKSDFDDVDSLINNSVNNNNNNNANIDNLIPTVPDVDISKIDIPDLSEDLKNNIEKEIENEINPNSEYFTKDQVDDLINERLKSFESQMQAMKSESEKLAEKLKESEQKREKEDKVRKNLIFAPNKNNENDSKNNKNDDKEDNPFASSESSYLEEKNEIKKKEEEELKIIQRSKALVERKRSPMFKMQGGGGGESSMEQDNIVILDKNLLINIKDTDQGIVPTKTQDLTRVILQGKIIEATLETAINTDVVSQVRAIVTRDIYAEYGKNILIPKGSRLVGTFQSNVTTGVSRLGIVWNRIIRVDGLSLNISANAADQLGRGGVEGDLDNKYFQILRNSFLSSLITIATSIAVDEVSSAGGLDINYDKDSGVTTYSGDATAYAVREATKDFMDDVDDIVDGMKKEKPTIRIAQGTKIVVVVNQDLNLPIYKKK